MRRAGVPIKPNKLMPREGGRKEKGKIPLTDYLWFCSQQIEIGITRWGNKIFYVSICYNWCQSWEVYLNADEQGPLVDDSKCQFWLGLSRSSWLFLWQTQNKGEFHHSSVVLRKSLFCFITCWKTGLGFPARNQFPGLSISCGWYVQPSLLQSWSLCL